MAIRMTDTEVVLIMPNRRKTLIAKGMMSSREQIKREKYEISGVFILLSNPYDLKPGCVEPVTVMGDT